MTALFRPFLAMRPERGPRSRKADRRGDRVWPIGGRRRAAARSPSPERDSARDASRRDARRERIAAGDGFARDMRLSCGFRDRNGAAHWHCSPSRTCIVTDAVTASVAWHRPFSRAATNATTGRIESGRQPNDISGATHDDRRDFRHPDGRVEVRRIETLESSCSVVVRTGVLPGETGWRRGLSPSQTNTA